MNLNFLKSLKIPIIILSLLIISNLFFLNEKDFGKENKMSILDKIYYSFISFTTVGFGDFYPVTKKGRIISIIQNSVMVFLPLFLMKDMKKIISNLVILCIAFGLHSFYILKESNEFNIIKKLYHTFIVHTTIGYGDISPSSSIGKFINIIHPLSVYILNTI